MARHGFLIIGSLLFVLLFLSPMILADQVQFLELAKDVPDDRLHAALHSYNDGKFKHGIFPGDRTALEAVHRERAADATALVLLAKRQSTNTTISTTHTTTTTSSTTTRLSSSSSSSSTTTTTHTTTGPASSTSNTDPTSTTPQPSSTPSQSTRSTTLRTTKTITGENGQPSTTTEFTVVVEQATDDGTPSPTPEPSQTPGPPGMQQPSNGVEGLKVRWIEAAGAAGAAALVFFML
ncbi:hypothetical protein Q9L58_003040 [Maublancomyces gigas]|uniref:Uncharacterized protein n=1 Tax=Discina gigas TaxID=1032678 RepID=A0ABR3GQF3_9PEZI